MGLLLLVYCEIMTAGMHRPLMCADVLVISTQEFFLPYSPYTQNKQVIICPSTRHFITTQNVRSTYSDESGTPQTGKPTTVPAGTGRAVGFEHRQYCEFNPYTITLSTWYAVSAIVQCIQTGWYCRYIALTSIEFNY